MLALKNHKRVFRPFPSAPSLVVGGVSGSWRFTTESQTRSPVPFGTHACRVVECSGRVTPSLCSYASGWARRLLWYNSTWGGPYESQTKMLLSRSAPAACCRVVCSVRGPLIFWHKPSGQVRDSCGMRRCQRPQPPGDALFRIANDAVLFRPTAFSFLLGGVVGPCPFLPPACAGWIGSVTPAEARSLQ